MTNPNNSTKIDLDSLIDQFESIAFQKGWMTAFMYIKQNLKMTIVQDLEFCKLSKEFEENYAIKK